MHKNKPLCQSLNRQKQRKPISALKQGSSQLLNNNLHQAIYVMIISFNKIGLT